MSDADTRNGGQPGLIGDFGHAGGMQAQAPGGFVSETTTAGFPADVIQESRNQPVLVDFWAPWCGPCKQLTPVLEKVVNAAGGRVKLVKMNIDDHPSIPGQLGIQSIPAVIAFKDGQPVDGFMGAIPESQVREFIERLGGDQQAPKIEEALKAAADARVAGDHETAGRIYAMVLEAVPDNTDAIGGMAEMLVEAGDIEAAKGVLDKAPPEKADAPAIASVRARIALAEQAASLGDPAEFERRLAENPKDHQARFDLAMIQNVLGDRQAAADNLLEIVKTDRGWNNDAARTQLLTFFEAWGPGDEATMQARRKLSSLLFS